jgi:hypothetical protein
VRKPAARRQSGLAAPHPTATIAQPDARATRDPGGQSGPAAQPAPQAALATRPAPRDGASPAGPPVAVEQSAPVTGPDPASVANPSVTAPAPDTPAPDGDEPPLPQQAPDELERPARPASRGFGELVGSAVARLTERRAPSSSVEVIDDLSRRSDTVMLLYLVVVSEPVPPPRRSRARRATVATELARAAMSDADPWYVRAFTADQHLRPAGPLPRADRLRERDLPARWGEYFDLFDCIDDIEEAWERDTASFVRRGLTEEPHHVVVFLAGEPPTGSAESVRRLAELGAAAEVVWVTFAPQAPEATDDFRATGTLFFRDHDDVVNEIVQLLREAEASRKPGSAG